MMVTCNRCGTCCHLKIDHKRQQSCKYLVRLSGTTTICRIYKNRLGMQLGNNNKCNLREDVHENFYSKNGVPCPYNKKEWEVRP